MSDTLQIKHLALVDVITRTLVNAGVPRTIAEVEASIMAEADLLGVPSHGVRMLPSLLLGIREGRANPNPQVRVLRSQPAACVLDGDNGPGRFISAHAMQRAIDYAKQNGIGACWATRVTHWGRAHAYAYRAALAGCVGICATNAIPNMLAWGSSAPLLGNNPLAIGVPRAVDQDPVILDMAMSQAAVGKITTALREGRSIPTSWGLDALGKPTDDPAALLVSRKLTSFGDYKGVGLAFMMELLTSALVGGLLAPEIAALDPTGLDSHSSKLFVAIDVETFVDRQVLAERIDTYLAYLSQAEPDLDITYPGQRGWQARDRFLVDGIPIHAKIVDELRAVGIVLE